MDKLIMFGRVYEQIDLLNSRRLISPNIINMYLKKK